MQLGESVEFRNDVGHPWLDETAPSANAETRQMMSLPVDRALSIFGALADRSETAGVRESLSKYLLKRYADGERDQHRLTVDGLSYLRDLYRAIDSRS